MSTLVIAGSARRDGDTATLVGLVIGDLPASVLDLNDFNIDHYRYDAAFDRDDFGKVVDQMLQHELLILATPVYWYAMSGRMKVFMDRFTDLVTTRKDLGRALKGRIVVVLACGSEAEPPDGFEVPFRDTAEYLSMKYGGMFYAASRKGTFSDETRTAAGVFAKSHVK